MGAGELSGKPDDEMLGDYLRWTSIPSHGNRDKLRLCGPLVCRLYLYHDDSKGYIWFKSDKSYFENAHCKTTAADSIDMQSTNLLTKNIHICVQVRSRDGCRKFIKGGGRGEQPRSILTTPEHPWGYCKTPLKILSPQIRPCVLH